MNAVTESKLTKFLVVVEEKARFGLLTSINSVLLTESVVLMQRVPYVQPLEWTRTAFEAAGGNCMKAHLPQILMSVVFLGPDSGVASLY